MFSDPIQWQLIRAKVLQAGVSKRQVMRDTGIHWRTLEKVLKHPLPLKGKRKKHSEPRRLSQNRPTLPRQKDIVTAIKRKVIESAVFIRDTIQAMPQAAAPVAELNRLARFLEDRGFGPFVSSKSPNLDLENHQWMQRILHKKLSAAAVQSVCPDHPDIELLVKVAWSGSSSERKKAIVVLAKLKGVSARSIQRFTKGSGRIIKRYWENFQSGGQVRLFLRKHRRRKAEDEGFRSAFFALLHSPPSTHGINRTTWKWDDLVRCLRE